jgi:uncharacterized protein
MTDNVQLIKDAYEAFERDDIPSILAVFDPSIEWREAEGNPLEPEGTPWIGPEAVAERMFTKLESDWDGFTVSLREFHDAGDTVVVECRYTGVYKATGKRLDAQGCHVWKIHNGKLASFQQYVDTAQLQDVQGVRVGPQERVKP